MTKKKLWISCLTIILITMFENIMYDSLITASFQGFGAPELTRDTRVTIQAEACLIVPIVLYVCIFIWGVIASIKHKGKKMLLITLVSYAISTLLGLVILPLILDSWCASLVKSIAKLLREWDWVYLPKD